MSFFLKNISIYPLKLFFDQLQQKFFSFTHNVLTKHIIIKIVSLSRDGNGNQIEDMFQKKIALSLPKNNYLTNGEPLQNLQLCEILNKR